MIPRSTRSVSVGAIVPSNRLLEEARADRDRLERERADAQSKYGNITSTQERVSELITSVDNFESNYLPLAATGLPATVVQIERMGAESVLLLDAGVPIRVLAARDDAVNRGDIIHLRVTPERIHLFEREGDARAV